MDTKPGVKTSEFWLVLATAVCGFLAKKFGVELDPLTVIAVVTPVVGYVLQRGWVKKSA